MTHANLRNFRIIDTMAYDLNNQSLNRRLAYDPLPKLLRQSDIKIVNDTCSWRRNKPLNHPVLPRRAPSFNPIVNISRWVRHDLIYGRTRIRSNAYDYNRGDNTTHDDNYKVITIWSSQRGASGHCLWVHYSKLARNERFIIPILYRYELDVNPQKRVRVTSTPCGVCALIS
eukprot:267253_1